MSEVEHCALGSIPELLLAFTAIIPSVELAEIAIAAMPDVPAALVNIMLEVLFEELGLDVTIEIETIPELSFELPELAPPGLDILIEPIIELLLGMVAITMPPLEIMMIVLDPSIEMPTIPVDIPAFIAEKLPVPPLTAEASVALASCLVEIVEGFMP